MSVVRMSKYTEPHLLKVEQKLSLKQTGIRNKFIFIPHTVSERYLATKLLHILITGYDRNNVCDGILVCCSMHPLSVRYEWNAY